jgi:hypothetical protein
LLPSRDSRSPTGCTSSLGTPGIEKPISCRMVWLATSITVTVPPISDVTQSSRSSAENRA